MPALDGAVEVDEPLRGRARAAPPGRPRAASLGSGPSASVSGDRPPEHGEAALRRRGSRARSSGRAARSSAPRASRPPARCGGAAAAAARAIQAARGAPKRSTSARQASSVAGAVAPARLLALEVRLGPRRARRRSAPARACRRAACRDRRARAGRCRRSASRAAPAAAPAGGRSASSATRSSGLSPATSSPRRPLDGRGGAAARGRLRRRERAGGDQRVPRLPGGGHLRALRGDVGGSACRAAPRPPPGGLRASASCCWAAASCCWAAASSAWAAWSSALAAASGASNASAAAARRGRLLARRERGLLAR